MIGIKSRKLVFKILVLCMTILVLTYSCENLVYANSGDTIVVVSLGDSYSSGEGIEPFYGQFNSDGTERTSQEKRSDKNWLAHRSTKSWGSMLKIPGVEGTMGDYFTDLPMYEVNSEDNLEAKNAVECKWYFKAASGAETKHISDAEFQKTWSTVKDSGSDNLPKQIDVFSDIEENGEMVNYVTLTIGGNDVGFDSIISTCATGYNVAEDVKDKIDNILEGFDSIANKIEKVYKDIKEAAESQAIIIVAGYPKLLSDDAWLISASEAEEVNNGVSKFNDRIEAIVNKCYLEGIKIYFVDVEEEFDKDGGHQAGTEDAWINGIIIGWKSEDLIQPNYYSYYSVHPNEKGAQAYAGCVQEKIDEIENHYGTISGKVSSASDDKAIEGARVDIYTLQEESVNEEVLLTTLTSDTTGHYSTILPEGNYRLEISADKYITFSVYATVTAGQTQYMETLLMVASGTTKKGIVSGVISDATTGDPLESAAIIIRRGWNNTEYGVVVSWHHIWDDDNGKYQLELDAGNYTFYIHSQNYTSTYINVAVRPGETTTKDATITLKEFKGYRIVLTWGKNPRDLDAHMVEYDADGIPLHVYFKNKGLIRSNLESCILDLDDRDGYGPETITLEIYDTQDAKNAIYYYYVHRYAGIGTLTSSNAQVRIYKNGKIIAIRNIPTNLGAGRYWNVFAIVDGQIIFKDTITNRADLTYAMRKSEGESTVMLATSVLATDSEAMIATDSDAILATGSEAIIDTDGETLHDKYDAVKEDIGDEDGEKDGVVAEYTYDMLPDGEVIMDIETNVSVGTDEGIASELSEEKLQDEKSDMDVADVAEEDVEVETRSNTDKTDAVNDVQVYTATPSNVA